MRARTSGAISLLVAGILVVSPLAGSAAFAVPLVAPDAPTGLSVTRDVDSNSFTANWSAPSNDGGSDITGYSLSLQELDVPGLPEQGATAPDVLTAHFSAETLGHHYTVTVSAVNAIGPGAGVTSASFSFVAIAPSSPQNVNLERVGSGTLEAHWDAPAYDGGSEVTSYFPVVTDSQGREYLSSSDIHGTSAIFSVSNLVADSYTVTVQAIANNLASVGAQNGPITTTAATIPDIPQINFADPVGYHDPYISIDWMTPGDGGDTITHVTATLYDGAGQVLRTAEVHGNETSYQFDGLANGTDYSVTVEATNRVGDSGESAPVSVTTLSTTPTAPPSDFIEQASPSGLDLTITGNTAVAVVFNASIDDWVYGIAYSTATPLGWAKVDDSGKATWTLPTLAATPHHLVVLDNSGGIIGSAIFTVASDAGVTPDPDTAVAPTDTDSALAATGAQPDGLIAAALLALLLGVALVTIRRRRMPGRMSSR